MTAPFFLSFSASVSPSSPVRIQTTNTLSVTSIPKDFFQPLLLDVLRSHFATYGDINRWVPLPSFGRIIVVYTRDDDAEAAKLHSDPIVLEKTRDRSKISLRVYRADPNPLLPAGVEPGVVPEANYLRPPKVEKNFLISPPGSPPVGWEPVPEEPPNATPLADDLVAALRKLQVQEKRHGLELLVDPEEGDGGVGVYVEDCASDDEDDSSDEDSPWSYAPSRSQWQPTVLPPLPVHGA
ncbi:Calcipressin-domain-containing protein [Mycena pura]|uniref:Calcipressin-domain-containing protein n=1 Tax=Mycena pura TaxID=153505 RepID=A0AAD6YHB9_9AGAR|nr:Calcipressin-domain-containing protein [Mycena pura]